MRTLIITADVQTACTIAMAYGGLLYKGSVVKPQDLEEHRQEIYQFVQDSKMISCKTDRSLSDIAVMAGSIFRPQKEVEYGPSYQMKAVNAGLPFFPDSLGFGPVKGRESDANFFTRLFSLEDYDRIVFVSGGEQSDRAFCYLFAHLGGQRAFVRVTLQNQTQEDIRAALNSRNEVESRCWFLSELTRFMLYWVSRYNLSRFATDAFGEPTEIKIKTLPALALLCEREKETQKDAKKPVYTLCIQVTTESGKRFQAEADEPRYPSLSAATAAMSKLTGQATIDKIKIEEAKTWPDGPHNRASLQQEAEKAYLITPEDTADILQKLFNKGLITNPDTTARTYPAGSGSAIRKKIEELCSTVPFSAWMKGRTLRKPPSPLFNADTCGIIVTGTVLNGLSKDELNIYALIVRQMIRTMLGPKRTSRKTVLLRYAGRIFKTAQTTVIEEGFSVLDHKGNQKSISLPEDLEEGMVLSAQPSVHEAKPRSKGRYTKDQYINILSKTDRKLRVSFASRTEAEALANSLIQSGDAEITGKTIGPTKAGLLKIGLLRGMSELLSPATVKEWECTLKKIRHAETQEESARISRSLIENVKKKLTAWCEELPRCAGKESDIPCPVCHEKLHITNHALFCRSCGYSLDKTLFGREMEEKVLGYFLLKHKTPMMYGFINEGKKVWGRLTMTPDFQATLHLESEYRCPVCGNPLRIREDGSILYCKSNCSFKMPLTVYGHKMTRPELIELFEDNTTPLLSFRTEDGAFNGILRFSDTGRLECIAVKE